MHTVFIHEYQKMIEETLKNMFRVIFVAIQGSVSIIYKNKVKRYLTYLHCADVFIQRI